MTSVFVIKNSDTGKYVADVSTGTGDSYTNRLEDARTFGSIIDAERDKCWNEQIFNVLSLLRPL